MVYVVLLGKLAIPNDCHCQLLLEVRKSIRLHKLLISIANYMGLSVIGCMSNKQCNCRSNSK